MIEEDELISKASILRCDYIKCFFCKGIIHISDKKCRWCGSKKIRKAKQIDLKYVSFFICLLIFSAYIFGCMKVGFLIISITALIFFHFFLRKRRTIWVKRNKY